MFVLLVNLFCWSSNAISLTRIHKVLQRLRRGEKLKIKGEVLSTTGHEGPEGE
jgi:hypothetical protein